ncbi:MAG: multidrug ABC transporter [Clostridia bacterium]|nr:multidrug ABC transporter [Clostridia bacterium]
MTDIKLPYLLLYLGSVFLASVSQVLLKKAAQREHKSVLAEYLDPRVIVGYGLFFVCTLLTMIAYRGIPMSFGPVLETTGYIYVTVFGITIFHEKMNPLKYIALGMILAGILIYAL